MAFELGDQRSNTDRITLVTGGFSAMVPTRLLVVLAVSASCFAQRPPDVSGWQDARWGMSEPQLIRAFQGRAKPLDTPASSRTYSDGVAKVGIRGLQVEGLPFQAQFVMDKNGLLFRVAIKAESNKPSGVDFLSLEKGLNAKYGPPDFVGNEGNTTLRRWIFPTTVIELTFLDAQATLGFRVLGVFYSANTTKQHPL